MRVRSKMGSLVMVVMIVGSLALASCSTAAPSPVASGTSTAATKPYGSLVIADPSTGSIDPLDAAYGLSSIFDSLLYRMEDVKYGPGIAERWQIAPDGLTHTFNIRRGVKFHDGSDLTGADVKFSIERMMSPESRASGASAWRAAVSKVDLIDDYTVVLRFKEPQYVLLVHVDGQMTGVVPKKYIEEKGIDYFRKNPIGSGPWKLVKWEAGQRIELEAVDDHWQVVPKFKNITLLDVPEQGTRVAMLRTGELDIAAMSSESVAGLKAAGVRVMSFGGGGQFLGYMFYDLDNPSKYPLGDVRVRKALTLSLNRQEMAEKLFLGYAKPQFTYPVLPQAPFFDRDVMLKKLDPYDPEGAKKLLAEAGYPNGFDMKIQDTVGYNTNTINQAIGGYFRKIGVTAELVPIDYATNFRMRSAPGFPQMWDVLWTFPSGGSVDFIQVQTVFHSTKGVPRNLRNPTLDKMIEEVLRTADPVQRNRLATEAVLKAKEEYSTLPLLDMDQILGVSPKVGEIIPPATPASTQLRATQFAYITHSK